MLLAMFAAMKERLGPSCWWPARSPFEVAVGAILTQNTNWGNVEKAIENLGAAGALDPLSMYNLPEAALAALIRPAGYFRVKTVRLKEFLNFLRHSCNLKMEDLAVHDLEELRPRLLGVRGIGPETADSILLYALGKAAFVVDAYTRRLANRHMLVHEDITYDELREFYMDALPQDVELFNEYHALIVRTVKKWCLKKEPLCKECPLRDFL